MTRWATLKCPHCGGRLQLYTIHKVKLFKEWRRSPLPGGKPLYEIAKDAMRAPRKRAKPPGDYRGEEGDEGR